MTTPVAGRPGTRVLYFGAETVEPTAEIPDRAAFKASEVCEIAGIPPYVLRSWEKEFPGLGAAPRPGGPRIYRRSDVEHVLRIKQLVFADGLTLAGARRKLEGEPPPEPEEDVLPVPAAVRERVAQVKSELRSLLEMLTEKNRAADAPVRDAGGSQAEPPPIDPGEKPAPKPRRAARAGKRGSEPPATNVE